MSLALEKPLTQHLVNKPEGQMTGLTEYKESGGYDGLKAALAQSPDAVMEEVKSANLRGRGGAGFPTGMKWSFVPKGADQQKYIIANADEMEPGTFKDRWLMEGDPHQLIEGMIISAYAIGASVGYVFLRADYPVAAAHMQRALEQAYNDKLLGSQVMGSRFSFDLFLHTSAGRYICGEETALINSLEGKRANPRAKPPFPQVSGLFGKPTVVNNVETFCNIPHILRHGAQWFKDLGIGSDAGTKIFGVSGRVKNPGAWELPMGVPIRDILEDHAGGMMDGVELRGLLPGGGSTDFLVPEHFDLPMDYESIAKAGSRMGTGTMILLDDQTCPVAMVLNLIQFFAQESCGWCTPCRNGLPYIRSILTDIENGQGQMSDLDTLAEYCSYIGPGNTFCALAPGASEPLQSALKYFRDDFVAHIEGHACPYK